MTPEKNREVLVRRRPRNQVSVLFGLDIFLSHDVFLQKGSVKYPIIINLMKEIDFGLLSLGFFTNVSYLLLMFTNLFAKYYCLYTCVFLEHLVFIVYILYQ